MNSEKRLKIGDKLNGMITGIDEKGRGQLRAGTKPGLAYFTIPGEIIAGTVTARAGGELRVKADAIVMPSSDRVTPRCPHASVCGGCPWQMISYERQCAMKLALVNEALAAEGLPTNYRLSTTDFISAPRQYYHRNRMDYVFGVNGELGLKTPEHWQMVLNLSTCFMLSPEVTKIMDAVRELTKESNAPFWNNRSH